MQFVFGFGNRASELSLELVFEPKQQATTTQPPTNNTNNSNNMLFLNTQKLKPVVIITYTPCIKSTKTNTILFYINSFFAYSKVNDVADPDVVVTAPRSHIHIHLHLQIFTLTYTESFCSC